MIQTLEQRFLCKVSRVESGCHEWQSTIKKDGYGSFWMVDKVIQAHRAAWIIFRGDIGKLHVLHKCDNRRCVNPDHLYLGTHSDNVRDKYARFPGQFPNMSLPREQYAEVARLYDAGGVTQQELADRFGIDQTTVSKICIRMRKLAGHNLGVN